jgi:hypothetical protein
MGPHVTSTSVRFVRRDGDTGDCGLLVLAFPRPSPPVRLSGSLPVRRRGRMCSVCSKKPSRWSVACWSVRAGELRGERCTGRRTEYTVSLSIIPRTFVDPPLVKCNVSTSTIIIVCIRLPSKAFPVFRPLPPSVIPPLALNAQPLTLVDIRCRRGTSYGQLIYRYHQTIHPAHRLICLLPTRAGRPGRNASVVLGSVTRTRR